MDEIVTSLWLARESPKALGPKTSKCPFPRAEHHIQAKKCNWSLPVLKPQDAATSGNLQEGSDVDRRHRNRIAQTIFG
jgi:hypothetical protein